MVCGRVRMCLSLSPRPPSPNWVSPRHTSIVGDAGAGRVQPRRRRSASEPSDRTGPAFVRPDGQVRPGLFTTVLPATYWPRSFHRYRLGQVARLVDVGSKSKRSMVGDKLQWNRKNERRYERRHVWKGEHRPAFWSERSSLPIRNQKRPALAGDDLVHGRHRPLKTFITRRNHYTRQILVDQRDRSVFAFSCSVAFA